MDNCYRHIATIGLVLLIATGSLYGQKAKKKKTKARLEYVADHNRTEKLVATILIKDKRYSPLSDADVLIYCINDTTDILLAKLRSNEMGEAVFILDDNPKIFVDSLGLMQFMLEYKGTATNKRSKKGIVIKRIKMDVSFFQKDTSRYIDVNVHEAGPKGQTVPVEGLEIALYIKGTFSLLEIAKLETDKNGIAIVEFPVGMPGDTAGVLTIAAQIEEDDLYGTVKTSGKINWGIPVPLATEKHRGLGDTDAPLWMVYTLITLLSAVWLHYFYVIFLIVKIKLAK